MPGSSTLPRRSRPAILGPLGRACFRHRRLTLLAWIVGVACLITLWTRFGAPAQDNFAGNDPGQTLLNQHFHRQSGDTLTLAIRSNDPIGSPAVRARITSALTPFARAPHVTSVTSPYQAAGQISAHGHVAFAVVQFGVPSTKISNGEALALMHDARSMSGRGVHFYLGGDVVDLAETPYGGASDGVGILAAAIVLLIAFGSLLAMGLPVLTAVLGIGAGLSLIALLGHVFPAPSFSPIVASMIGLGVGVDYALFILTRFREALHRGQDSGERGGHRNEHRRPDRGHRGHDRDHRNAGAAGPAPVPAQRGRHRRGSHRRHGPARLTHPAPGPARLHRHPAGPALPHPAAAVAGWPPSRDSPAGRAARPAASRERWAALIQRRPLLAALLSTGLILLLAAPALGMKLSMPDESSQARGTMGYSSYATMARGFGPGFDAPLIVAAALPSPTASTTRLAHAIAATPGIARVGPVRVSSDGQAALMVAYPTTGEQDSATNALVNRIRTSVIPQATAGTGIRAYLTGPNAGNVSFANIVGQRLPWLIGVVVVLSMLLLVVMFRSVTVAVKAAVMNLLSISAAYGVLVAITQYGWLGHLFGFPEKMPVTTWVPMFLFVILFGLSMDYEVFLLSRIRESYDATGDNAASVAAGLARTARVITAAAAIMVVVFLSFVLGANVSVKQVGLGLAVAVLIDATVVRMVLVPAVMELLGKANWWLPRPLARILPPASPREGEPLAAARTLVSATDVQSGG